MDQKIAQLRTAAQLNPDDRDWLLDVAAAALLAIRGFDAVDSMTCKPPDLGDDYLDAMYSLRDVMLPRLR